MGKTLLLLALAAALSGSVALFTSSRTGMAAEENLGQYEQTVVAREIAQSGFNMASERLHREYSSWRDGYQNLAFQGGHLEARLTGPAVGPVQLSVTGQLDSAEYHIQGLFTRVMDHPAAVLISADTATVTYEGSSFLITGEDTRPFSLTGGNRVDGLSSDAAGIRTTTFGLADQFYAPLTGNLFSDRRSRVRGVHGNGDVMQGSFPVFVEAVYQQALANVSGAHLFTSNQTFAARSFGTRGEPVIVVVKGDASLHNVTGFGILVVEGSLTLSGTTVWEGLVYARKLGEMSVVQRDASTIIGGLVIRSLSSLDNDYAIELPTCGQLSITYKGTTAPTPSQLYLKHPDAVRLFNASTADDQQVTPGKIFDKGERLNLFIRTTLPGWQTQQFDHYAAGPVDVYSGQPHARIKKTSPLTWRIEFEDQPGRIYQNGQWVESDWDYDDKIVEVELLPQQECHAHQDETPPPVDEHDCHTCKGKKFPVLHFPPGNPNNAQQLCLPEPAVETHYTHHGDVICGWGQLDLGDGEIAATLAGLRLYSMQAESGVKDPGPIRISAGAGAHGGSYIEANPGSTPSDLNTIPNVGAFSYTFSVDKAGDYAVLGRVIAPTTQDDSFWIQMDNGPWIKWNNIAPGTTWHWDRVHDSDKGDQHVTFSLTAGTHTLRVLRREDGTLLDELLVTNNLQFQPPDNWTGTTGGGASAPVISEASALDYRIQDQARVYYSSEALARLVTLFPHLEPLSRVLPLNTYSGPAR